MPPTPSSMEMGGMSTVKVGADGKEKELIRLHAHDFFGEHALITNDVRTANIIAVGNVECLVLERSSFQTLLTDVQDDLVDAMTQRDKSNAQGGDDEEDEATGPVTNYAYDELQACARSGLVRSVASRWSSTPMAKFVH